MNNLYLWTLTICLHTLWRIVKSLIHLNKQADITVSTRTGTDERNIYFFVGTHIMLETQMYTINFLLIFEIQDNAINANTNH